MGMKTTRRLPKATCVPSIGVKCMYSRLRRISGYVLWNPGAPHFTGFQRTYPEILLEVLSKKNVHVQASYIHAASHIRAGRLCYLAHCPHLSKPRCVAMYRACTERVRERSHFIYTEL